MAVVGEKKYLPSVVLPDVTKLFCPQCDYVVCFYWCRCSVLTFSELMTEVSGFLVPFLSRFVSWGSVS